MTKSGITRRIDELGRIVVPKEIRYNLGIRDGEPLEIYTENNNIIIKKYSQVENIKDYSKNLCNVIADVCNVDVLVTDREKILTYTGKKELEKNKLEEKYKLLIDNRETYISDKKENIFGYIGYVYIVPIITSIDCSGLIFIISKEKEEFCLKLIKLIQKMLIQKLDVA